MTSPSTRVIFRLVTEEKHKFSRTWRGRDLAPISPGLILQSASVGQIREARGAFVRGLVAEKLPPQRCGAAFGNRLGADCAACGPVGPGGARWTPPCLGCEHVVLLSRDVASSLSGELFISARYSYLERRKVWEQQRALQEP